MQWFPSKKKKKKSIGWNNGIFSILNLDMLQEVMNQAFIYVGTAGGKK